MTAKHKSKSHFTGQHGQEKQSSNSYSMDSQRLRQSPLPQHQQNGRGRGFMFAIATKRRGKSLFEKSKFSTAEPRGAKSNFSPQDTSHYLKIHNIWDLKDLQ